MTNQKLDQSDLVHWVYRSCQLSITAHGLLRTVKFTNDYYEKTTITSVTQSDMAKTTHAWDINIVILCK